MGSVYERFAELGLAYGPGFQGMHSLWTKAGEALAEVALPSGSPNEGFGIHPVLLDSAVQALVAATGAEAAGELFLPFEMGRFTVYQDCLLYTSRCV